MRNFNLFLAFISMIASLTVAFVVTHHKDSTNCENPSMTLILKESEWTNYFKVSTFTTDAEMLWVRDKNGMTTFFDHDQLSSDVCLQKNDNYHHISIIGGEVQFYSPNKTCKIILSDKGYGQKILN